MPAPPVDPKQITKIQSIAENLIRSGDSQAAIDELDRASENLSAYPLLYKLKGIARLVQGNTTEARLIFEELEGCFGDDPEFLNVYGVALRRERDFQKAKEMYERGLEIKSDEPALLSNFGNLLIDLGSYSEAKIALEKAISIAPSYKDAQQNLARLERLAIAITNQSHELHVEKDDDSGKMFDLDQTTKISDGEAASDWLKLGAVAFREKKFEEALLFARKAIQAQPDMAAACKLAGEVLISLNRHTEAERLLLYGTLLGEDDVDTLSNLGGLAATNGFSQLAKLLLERAICLQPEHKTSKENLLRLKSKISEGSYKSRPLF
jgi:Flp pilus assembly protein TadD